MNKLKLILILLSLVISGCGDNENEKSTIKPFEEVFWVEDYVRGLDFPWSFSWLPNGDMLVTERLGKLKLVRNGKVINEIKNVPNVISSSPFDGLLDIKIDPDFKENSLVYLSYTKGNTTNRTGVVYRARLENNSLVDGEEIYNTSPAAPTGGPNITKLLFLKDKSLIFAVGSSGQHAYNMVQRLDGDIGKIIRINRDGSIPKDNLIKLNNPNSKDGLWALGLRSVGGLTLDGKGQLWAVDMGPKGGDELNIIQPGGNHGFPLVSWGFDYSGKALSEVQNASGFVDPVISWSPSISPFGLTYYDKDVFSNWHGDFFLGVLGEQTIIRLRIKNKKIIQQENLLPNLNERIRSIETGPDGYIYASTDSSNGKIIRLRPGNPTKKDQENISVPFKIPENSSAAERLKLHGVMQNEETMIAFRAPYDPIKAELLYNQKCLSCHNLKAIDGNNIGPHLESIAGRRSGSLTNYPYSVAMTSDSRTSVIWDSRSITAFLTNPNGIFPGTKMVAEPLSYEDAILVGKFLTKIEKVK